jgi:hypothetical protein
VPTLRPVVAVYVGGVSTSFISPQSAVVRQLEYEHDIITLDFSAVSPDVKALVSGMPVQITYGMPPNNLRQFWGYVNDPQGIASPKSQTYAGNQTTVVRCVGASFWMKNQNTKSWVSRTCSQIAQELSTEYRLNSSIQNDSTVWPNLLQGGVSDWAWLSQLAQKIGYVSYCNGLTLHFHERDTNPQNLPSYVPIIDLQNPAQTQQFAPALGAAGPAGGTLAARTYTVLDPNTLNVVTLTDSGMPLMTKTLGSNPVAPVFKVTETGLVSGSMGEGQTKLNASVANNKLSVTANLLIAGNVAITQGSLVYLINTGPGLGGLWYVMGATHQISLASFTTSLSLGRESLGPTETYQFSSAVPTQRAVRLVNYRWVPG